MLFSFISLFYVCMGVFFIFFYLKEDKDVWYKTFHFIGFMVTIVLMLHLLIFQTNIDNDFPIDTDYIVLDDMDINNLIPAGQEEYTSSTIYFVHNFFNVEHRKVGSYTHGEFCFYYNNSDVNPNVVRVVTGVNAISQYIYLPNSTSGITCSSINKTYIQVGELLGLNCLDCSPVNPLNIPKFQTNSEVLEIHITKNDPETYEIELENSAHGFYIESHALPKEQVNNNIDLLFICLGVFVLLYGMRAFYNLTVDGTDYK